MHTVRHRGWERQGHVELYIYVYIEREIIAYTQHIYS